MQMSNSEEKSSATQILEQENNLRNTLSNSEYFQMLSKDPKEGGLPRIEIDGTQFYIAEGDLLLDEDQLLIYADNQAQISKDREVANMMANAGMGMLGITDLRGLVGMVNSRGKIVRWAEGLILSYCVLKQTFSSEARYNGIRDEMKQAAKEWEEVCGVKFEYKEELDNSDSVRPDGVVFPVREIDSGGRFIAAAFFPNDPPSRRRVVIDPSYFDPTLRFRRVGILVHELGHVLGFRHEHIRSSAPPACPNESLFETVVLTDYDPQSVMHYFCGGVGTTELKISELDKVGAQQLYGQSFDKFNFVSV